MGLFSKENKAGQVDLNNLPCHVAVIMDGNGRWAQKRGLPRSAGSLVFAGALDSVPFCSCVVLPEQAANNMQS